MSILMDDPQADQPPIEAQGTFVQLEHLSQLFGNINLSTTNSFPKKSLLSRSFDRPFGTSSTAAIEDESRRPSWWSMSSSNG